MPPTIALILFAALIFWLFAEDTKHRGRVSAALWIPLVWAFIISSRPLSLWLGVGGGAGITDGGPQDTLIDKALFLLLIGTGLFVLSRRRVNWRSIIRENRWLFLYFLYLGISVLWSDDSFVSFKRWIKDFGNIVMVLVVLSEEKPNEAIRAFLARYTYLLIPLSILVMKYYPAISRYYDSWTSQPVLVGMSSDKNTFGMALFVCGIFLIWSLLESTREERRATGKREFYAYSVLLALTAWLLSVAHSATAISCMVLGACILLGVRVPAIKNQVKRLGTYTVGLALLIAILQATGLWDLFVKVSAEAVGRDATLHGRGNIWREVLSEDINPLTGVGFYSFWSAERNLRLSSEGGFFYQLGTAHNGYIETYLNSGIIGLALLAAMIGSAATGIKRAVLGGSSLGVLRLSFLVTTAIYNISESGFDRLVPIWFVMLLVMLEYPRPVETTGEGDIESLPDVADRDLTQESIPAYQAHAFRGAPNP